MPSQRCLLALWGWLVARQHRLDKMAKERSELAVISALAPVCADKFRALPDAHAKQAALSNESWKRRTNSPRSS